MEKKWFIVGAVVAGAYISGRYHSAPPKIIEVEKEKIVYKERVDEQENKNKVTQKKETRLPDGTTTIETVITFASETNRKTDREKDIDRETSREVVNAPGVILQGMVGVSPWNLPGGLDYGGSVTVPIPVFGLPIYGGAWMFIRQDFKFGLSAGVSF